MTGLRKISGNNKHSVVLSSDIKEASFVTQTLTSHHVCNRGGFFCLQISSHSRIMRVSHFSYLTRMPIAPSLFSISSPIPPHPALRSSAVSLPLRWVSQIIPTASDERPIRDASSPVAVPAPRTPIVDHSNS